MYVYGGLWEVVAGRRERETEGRRDGGKEESVYFRLGAEGKPL